MSDETSERSQRKEREAGMMRGWYGNRTRDAWMDGRSLCCSWSAYWKVYVVLLALLDSLGLIWSGQDAAVFRADSGLLVRYSMHAMLVFTPAGSWRQR